MLRVALCSTHVQRNGSAIQRQQRQGHHDAVRVRAIVATELVVAAVVVVVMPAGSSNSRRSRSRSPRRRRSSSTSSTSKAP